MKMLAICELTIVAQRSDRRQASNTAADGEEQSAFVAERSDPAKLRQPAFGPPVVGGPGEEIRNLVDLVAKDRARIRSQVLDAVLGEPPLHLGQRVHVLLGMLVLITEPCLTPRRLAAA